MSKDTKFNNLFEFSEAKDISTKDRMILLALVIAGVICILRFGDWWFRKDHIGSIWLFTLLSTCFWYSILRLILIWVNYLMIKKPPHIPS